MTTRAKRYFGAFENIDSVRSEFKLNRSDILDGEILLAVYDVPGYEGTAFVLFERDGKLYEVNGSHCSCYGLESQWEPEETSWKALAMRKGYSISSAIREVAEAAQRFQSLIRRNGA